jgi:hypothetical protein
LGGLGVGFEAGDEIVEGLEYVGDGFRSRVRTAALVF